eukprot:5391471-Prymnesium_polylepis.1
MSRRAAALVVSLLAERAAAQGTPFACCYGAGAMVYGFCEAPLRGVSSWAEVKLCWRRMSSHFANTTVVGEYNLTSAEKYSIFTVVIDEGVREIVADPGDPPLAFDADTIPEGAVPELGYLPFEVSVVLPSPNSGSTTCPPFELRDAAFNFTLHGQQPRSRSYTPLTFSIVGCGRDAQTLRNISVAALGYANLQLSFVSLRDSHRIVSLDQPGGGGGDALSFEESSLENCTFRYFGGVTGSLGNAGGATQNGTVARDVSFLAADPAQYIPAYVYRPVGHRYTFGWYGSYPQEWGNTSSLVHLERCHVQFMYDVQLGS